MPLDSSHSNAKGISPLIAAVLLIAFTMAIAGIMATWATTFSRERLVGASEEAECIGALDISTLAFSNGTISVKIRNLSDKINLTSIKATIEYSDVVRNKADIAISDYNATDPLAPGGTTFFIFNTGDPTKPRTLEVIAGNCQKQSSILTFR
jgi:flagellin-like protein